MIAGFIIANYSITQWLIKDCHQYYFILFTMFHDCSLHFIKGDRKTMSSVSPSISLQDFIYISLLLYFLFYPEQNAIPFLWKQFKKSPIAIYSSFIN